MVPKFNFFITSTLSLCLFLVVALSFTSPKPADYRLISTLDVTGQHITTDHLKNVYLITNQNRVERYDSTGVLNGVFSDKRFGAMSTVDATSPFNILLFFKDFSTLLTTDNRFNVKNLFKLSTLNINFVSAACLSYDNYIWIFDQQEGRLKKINDKYEVLYKSTDLTQLLGTPVDPNFIIERDGFIFLNDPHLGILVFDIYGTYYSSFPISGLESFQVIKNNLVYYQDGQVQIFNYTEKETRSIPIPGIENVKSVKLEKNRLFVLTDKDLRIYSSSGR